jgi:hypothetical protein
MFDCLVARLHHATHAFRSGIHGWVRPSTRLVLGYALDHFRSRDDLIRENVLLRKQLEVACRKITRPHLTPLDRTALVLLARLGTDLASREAGNHLAVAPRGFSVALATAIQATIRPKADGFGDDRSR